MNRRVIVRAGAILSGAILGAIQPAHAAVKLITLPPRERVEIQLDHASATLVEEERLVPLAAGINDVVFAWANASIARDSIQFRCLSDPENIRVLSVSYPPGENALTWQVSAPRADTARVRISYIIGQLDKTFAYRAVADAEEKTLTLWQYVQLHNRAGEEFGVAGMWAGFGERCERPIGIGETKQVLAHRYSGVSFRKTYTASLAEFGYLDAAKRQLRVPMHYLVQNDAEHGLGLAPLPFGKARIFQDDGRGTVAFLGDDWAAFTPRDDELKLFLGVAKDVDIKRTIDRREQTRVLGNLYNYDVIVKYEIENFKDQPVVLDIVESLPALRAEIRGNSDRDVEWELIEDGSLTALHDPEKTTRDRAVFHVPLPARGADDKAVRTIHTLHVKIKNEW